LGFLDAELSITLTSDAQIAQIGRRFGLPERSTDVLAFSMLEGVGAEFSGDCLGDVVISVETAEAQAAECAVPLSRELGDLLIHGVLHLLGMNHQRPVQARAMRELEEHLRWELAQTARPAGPADPLL
jgi:probable rRNA maturation factor